MGRKEFDYGRSYTQEKAKDELVHSTPGCEEEKKYNTKNENEKKRKKKMERLSGSHPISLPHSGELFLIGSSRRKRENVRIGWGGAGQSGQGLRNNPEVGASENQEIILRSESGRFLGSVVPLGAAGSLLR